MRITEASQIATYYQALLDRAPDFVGIFYVAVKTTGVFCIATCRARKPKQANVEFYTTIKEVLDEGYRPCKVCKPTETAGEAPEGVQQALQLVRDHPKEKVSDAMLRQQQISPEAVRRWFKQHYGVTFHAYQRMLRINQAFREVQQGERTTHAAFDAGYESLSGFGYTYKKIMGASPHNSRAANVLLIHRLTTPLGPMFVAATDAGICLLEFVDRRMLETELGDLQRRLNARLVVGENEHTRQAEEELAEYFCGERRTFRVPLHTPGTAFQQRVWNGLQRVAYGTTATYQQQAEAIRQPTAVRAVAAANGANRVAIVIPCHRVIGKNGRLTGYGGGLERKRWLIAHERR